MRPGVLAGSILTVLFAVGCSAQQVTKPTTTTPKPLLVDEYAVLDDAVRAPALNDAAIQKRMDAARAHYLHALKQSEVGKQKEAARHFEASIAILNEMMTHPEINALPEYTRLSRSVIRDYEGKVTSIDDLDSNSSFFVLREKMFQEIELLPVSFQPAPSAEEIAEAIDSLVIGLPENEAVQQTIDYFTNGRGRKYMALWLERSGRYFPLYERILAEEGAPDELKYLSMIESGLNPRATSHAAAVGLWQFIGSTGRAYGMHADWYRDERRDPEKATRAAARYLLDLYDQMGDWHLALGSYNCGPGRMRRALRNADTTCYWEARKHLPAETRRYVPLYIAAAKIARDPSAFGFNEIEYHPPFRFDVVPVYAPYQLSTIADVAGCSVDDIRDLNPELLQNQVPPGEAMYDLRVPAGLGTYVAKVLDTLTVDGGSSMSFINHKVSSGETVTKIANRYGVSVSSVLDANDMTARSTLYRGSTLKIPSAARGVRITPEDVAEGKRRAAAQAREAGEEEVAEAIESTSSTPVATATTPVTTTPKEQKPTAREEKTKEVIEEMIAEVPTAERKRSQTRVAPPAAPVVPPSVVAESNEAVFVSAEEAAAIARAEAATESAVTDEIAALEVESAVEVETATVEVAEVSPQRAAPEVAAPSKSDRTEEIAEVVPESIRSDSPSGTADHSSIEREVVESGRESRPAATTIANAPIERPTTGFAPVRGELADAEALAQVRRYKVRRGETLNDIATKFNVSVRDLQESNPRLSPSGLAPGQVIRIR